ncbi:MAG: GGDEF domain-containing protein [Thermoguttaceae bacterium]
MLPTIINLFYAFASGLLGAAAASWLWYSHVRRHTAAASPGNSPAADAAVRIHKLATQAAFDFMVRIHELATQVAFDVGEHNSQVQEINEELTSSKSHDSAKVLDVVVKLVEANQRMQEKLTSTEQKLHEQTDQMQTLLAETRTDALTLLANRRAFDGELVKRFAEFRRQGRIFSLTVVDVDHFKDFNDTHGHRAGDEVLRNVAKVLRRKMRETDMVARYGGEEFAIIHPGTGLADACKSALRACEAIENHQFAHDGKSFHVTVSLGVAEVLTNENAVDTLRRADDAMYAAKQDGRNCVHFHDGEVFRRLGAGREPVVPSADIQQPSKPAPCTCEEDEKPRLVQDPGCRTRSEDIAEPETLLDLPGRTRFCQQVRNRMAEWKRGGPAFSVALIEVSRCDESGGNSGQQARELASRVTARCLAAATREMDVLGSYSPGCFALMIPTAGLADAIRVADRLLEMLSQQISLASGALPIFTLSVGVVQAIERDDATSVLKRAEMALDAADRGGRNRVYCHDGERVAPVTEILETTGHLA